MHTTSGQSKATNAPSHEEAAHSFTRAVSSKDPLSYLLPGQGLLSRQEGLLQRKCACGGTPGVDGECAECRKTRLQRGPSSGETPETARPIGREALSSPAQPSEGGVSGVPNPRFGHDFSRIAVFAEGPTRFQATELANIPEDTCEQEAERTADQVVRGPRVQPRHAAKKESGEHLQAERIQARDAGGLSAPSIVDEVIRSPGQPLDPPTRAFMEPRFGHDFSQVRIHTDAKAAESARAVNALAYTVGRDVVFGAGKYAPQSHEGRRLMAHELTHVVQQSPFLSRQPAAEGQQSSAPTSNTSASQRVGNLASLLESYANQADTQIASSEASADAIVPIRRDLADFRTGIERLRQVAEGGDESLCAAVLSGFTPNRLREASQYVIPAPGQQPVAIAEMVPTSLATKSLSIDQSNSAAEVEADYVAEAVTSHRQVVVSPGIQYLSVQRFLDAQAAQQLEQNLPAITLATGAALETATVTAGAIAAGGGPPGWVIGLAILAVVAIVAVGGYLYYRSQNAQPQPAPQPAPQPQTQAETETQTQTQTRADVDFDEDEQRDCRATAIAQRGGNTCHDQFATSVSGVTREWSVQTPEGMYSTYDALGRDRMLYEVKTGYRFLLNTSPTTYALRERTIHDFIDQSQNQLAVAMRCDYPLVWVFNDSDVADFVDGFIQPRVTFVTFKCDEDR